MDPHVFDSDQLELYRMQNKLRRELVDSILKTSQSIKNTNNISNDNSYVTKSEVGGTVLQTPSPSPLTSLHLTCGG